MSFFCMSVDILVKVSSLSKSLQWKVIQTWKLVCNMYHVLLISIVTFDVDLGLTLTMVLSIFYGLPDWFWYFAKYFQVLLTCNTVITSQTLFHYVIVSKWQISQVLPLLSLPRRLCFWLYLSVCLFVWLFGCLSVGNFTQKVMNRFWWNFQGWSGRTQGPIDRFVRVNQIREFF